MTDPLDPDAVRANLAYLDEADWRVDGPTKVIVRLAQMLGTTVPKLLAELAAYQRPGVPTYDQLLADHAKLLDERTEWVRTVREMGAENARLTRVVGNVMAGIKCPHRGGLCRLPQDHPGACQPTDAEERLVS
jgi:hypothetical protein